LVKIGAECMGRKQDKAAQRRAYKEAFKGVKHVMVAVP